MSLFALHHVSFSYPGGKKILNDVSWSFDAGKLYAISGASGAGKSTLLGLLAGLDTPTLGTVSFQDEDITVQGYTHHRAHNICLVFQNYNLIDYMTPLENVRLVKRDAGTELLEELGLSAEECRRSVLQLSGGQQQRVAIARALASEAPVILADEPTGNLDPATAREILEILVRAAHEHGKGVIVVTHSGSVSQRADVALHLRGGALSSADSRGKGSGKRH